MEQRSKERWSAWLADGDMSAVCLVLPSSLPTHTQSTRLLKTPTLPCPYLTMSSVRPSCRRRKEKTSERPGAGRVFLPTPAVAGKPLTLRPRPRSNSIPGCSKALLSSKPALEEIIAPAVTEGKTTIMIVQNGVGAEARESMVGVASVVRLSLTVCGVNTKRSRLRSRRTQFSLGMPFVSPCRRLPAHFAFIPQCHLDRCRPACARQDHPQQPPLTLYAVRPLHRAKRSRRHRRDGACEHAQDAL